MQQRETQSRSDFTLSYHYVNTPVPILRFHGCENDNCMMNFFIFTLLTLKTFIVGTRENDLNEAVSQGYPQSIFWSKTKKKCILL